MIAAFLLAIALASPMHKDLPLQRIHEDPPLEGTAPTALTLSPNGKVLAFLKPSAHDSEVLDLWGVRLPDGKPELLVATQQLLAGAAQKLTEQEKMALERKRISKRGITSYLWCGEAGDALLFGLSGDLYFAQLSAGAAPLVTKLTHDDGTPEMSPQCSKRGDQVVFTKAGNVVVLDVKTARTKELTSGASTVRTFGLAEFIAQEEMDRSDGTWWSPDGASLLVFEVDESAVQKKMRAQIFADRTEMFEQRYPAAGEANAVVKAHLVNVASKKSVLVQTPTQDGYLPRAGFLANGTPWIMWQSRDQKRVRVFTINPNGVLSPLFEENDAAWVELTSDFKSLKDGSILWSTEQTGVRQLVRIDGKTGARVQITAEPEPVFALEGVSADESTVYFTAYRDRGRQLHVFSRPLAGGPTTQLSTEPGTHHVVFDDTGAFYVDTFSSWGKPPRVTLKDARGHTVMVVDDNPALELAAADAPEPVWLDIPAADGKTMLNGVLMPPRGVDVLKGKAPVITYVYGGPGAQMVAQHWMRLYPLFVHWTQQGYGVLVVDNRGMAGRDRAFTRAHQNAFGDVEVKDVFAAVRHVVKSTPWIDPARVGMFGWSYGGFLAARFMLDDDTPFACAAAGAPVTDWTLYDTHYTERYIGMPTLADKSANPSYTSSNLSARAGLLKKPLLLMHGTADDNVLFEHTLRLSEALQKQSVPFEMMVYPGKAHGVTGRAAQLHVHRTVTRFFDQCLRPKV